MTLVKHDLWWYIVVMEQKKTKVIGYIRVSTNMQAEEGVSLDAQEQRIRAYCVAKDWNLLKIVRDEGYSAKDLNRPGMEEILTGCRKKDFDVVVTLKLDRLTRSVRDLGYLVEDMFKKNNVAFSSLQDNFETSTANGRMVMNILATIAQWERDIISERTREGMQFMKSGLMRVGAIPFGFDLVDGQLSPNPDEMETVQTVVAMRRKGQSYQKIAAYLNAKGISSKNRRKWHPKTVMGVVRHIRSLPRDHWVIKKYFPKGVETDVCKVR